MLRTGAPWRDLPERSGPYMALYNRFNRWGKRGIWLKVFEELAQRSPRSLQFIDSSIIRAHQHAAGGKKERVSRHRPFSWQTEHKIRSVMDQDGLPTSLRDRRRTRRQPRPCWMRCVPGLSLWIGAMTAWPWSSRLSGTLDF